MHSFYYLEDTASGECADLRLAGDRLIADSTLPAIQRQLKFLNDRKQSDHWKDADWKSFLDYQGATGANAYSSIQLKRR